MTISRAFYAASIQEFLSESSDSIVGKLTKHHTQDLVHDQQRAWSYQISLLQQQLQSPINGWIFFEFVIPRMGSRADVVLFIDGIVFVLEFKVGTTNITAADLRQAEGYCLDLHHFHAASHDLPIVPILIATESKVYEAQATLPALTQRDYATPNIPAPHTAPQVSRPIAIDGTTLYALIQNIATSQRGINLTDDRDGKQWAEAPYSPTPTIIEAAEALYANHNVEDIARNDAGAENLATTSSYVRRTIEMSRTNARKSIIFLTGVPGSGKTLAGLNIATSSAESDHAVFLSGNGPLVDVLREALARDDSRRLGIRKTDAKRKVASFVQNIHRFRDEALHDSLPPAEHVAIFDEAQRAWDQRHTAKFMSQKRSQ
ncbi:MAG: DNA/RNA helicase domain-containing protein, partial [Thermomicrobiales bacterium]